MQLPDIAPYAPVVVNDKTVAFLHFNGTIIDAEAKFSAQLTLECLDILDVVKVTQAIEVNPDVSFISVLLRKTKRSDSGFFVQFRYSTDNLYVGRPVSFVNARRRWLRKALVETIASS